MRNPLGSVQTSTTTFGTRDKLVANLKLVSTDTFEWLKLMNKSSAGKMTQSCSLMDDLDLTRKNSVIKSNGCPQHTKGKKMDQKKHETRL